tara:strand:- start:1108 stop:2187 length:1080 start_codon:yes stop_codon:yes gene_type:complete
MATNYKWLFDAEFNSQKYTENATGQSDTNALIKATDAYANHKKMYISFLHMPSQTAVFFKAFITTFTETYNSEWASETVYGRADPIYLFKNTQRKITLGFKVPAESQSEAFQNLGKVQTLLQFLYPNYTTLGGDVFAQTISQSPMVRLKVMNLLQDTTSHGAAVETLSGIREEKATGYLDYEYYIKNKYPMNVDPDQGLLGVIDNVTVNHNLETPDGGGFNEGSGVIMPKHIDVNISFSPIHEHALGWTATGDEENPIMFTNEVWPYAINTSEPIEPTPVPSGSAPTNNVENPDNESYQDPEAPMTELMDDFNSAQQDSAAAQECTTANLLAAGVTQEQLGAGVAMNDLCAAVGIKEDA